ncbi:hypothetical protein SpAn4DRAFT_1600 [Sporomusa ovata]|uniref:Uncharacterized protein n=1 Tax=Sporomusa ovata TaxID=2378 RepID=A0A0U1KT83_9FIRM|nr:hypothetical protein SpAn4DRAFT_1600 [Sporomusa ovata]
MRDIKSSFRWKQVAFFTFSAAKYKAGKIARLVVHIQYQNHY